MKRVIYINVHVTEIQHVLPCDASTPLIQHYPSFFYLYIVLDLGTDHISHQILFSAAVYEQ